MNRALPTERFEPGTEKMSTLLKIFTAVLVPCLLLNAALYFYYEKYQHNKGYVLVETKWEMLLSQTEPVDVLIIGDSSCNQGIDPVRIKEQTGLTALNLCTIGFMTFAQNSWILQYYIAKVGKPKYVFVTNVYDTWNSDDEALKTLAARISTDREFWMSLTPPLDVSQWSLWVQKYVPAYSQKKTNVSFAVDPQRIWNPPVFSFNPDGFMPEKKSNLAKVERDVKKQLAFVERAKQLKIDASKDPKVKDDLNVLSKINRLALHEFVKISERHSDVEFYLFHSPVVETLAADPAWQSYDAQMFDHVKKIIKPSPIKRHLRARVFRPEQMQNADHVTTDGAIEFTDFVLRGAELL